MTLSRIPRATRAGTLSCAVVLAASLAVTACGGDPDERKQAYLERADRYAESGQLHEAVIEYRNAIKIDPRFGQARARLAAVYESLGRSTEATEEYVRAADISPDDAELQLKAGTSLLAAGKTEEALARADAILERDSANVAAYVLRGNALARLHDFDRALADMEAAIRLDPMRGATYTQLGRLELERGRKDAAEAAFARAIEVAPQSAAAHLALANFYWAENRLPEAERALHTALQLDPDDEAANRAMAVFALSTGRPEDAEVHLKRLAKVSSGPTAKFALAEYYIATKRSSEAVELLEPLSTDPEVAPAAKQRLAQALAGAGEWDRAHAVSDELLEQYPDYIEAHLTKAQLLLDQKRLPEALTILNDAIANGPPSASAQFLLGKVHAARGDMAGAEAAFTEALKLNPSAVAAQVELSRLQLSTGAAARALRSAEEAVRHAPTSLDAQLALVRGLLAVGDVKRAATEIDRLLSVHPNVSAVHTQRAILAAMRNDAVEARSAFERALTLDPSSLEALAGLLALDQREGQAARAEARIRERIATGTPSTALLLLAARTFESTKNFPAAENALRRALTQQPSLLSAYSMLGRLYVAQGRLDEAVSEFDGLAAKESRPVPSLTMAGMILQAQGKADEARKRYERAIEVDPHAAIAANNLAWLYIEADEKHDVALRLAQAAAESLPDAPEVLDTLGWAYLKNAMPTLAVRTLARCVEKKPDAAACHYRLGLASLEVGDVEGGREALTRALKLKPEAEWVPDARRALAELTADTGA